MSIPPIIQYPLDLTGTSPTNHIVGEVRDILTDANRVFIPLAGPFYADSFTILDNETGMPLRPVDDYILAQPFSQASLRSGKDVQSAVVLRVSAPISVKLDYRVVGGEYSWNLDALQDLITQLDLDDRPIKWGSVLGRPTAYPAAPHIHDIGDTFGWEYVVWQLERITQAIMVGDEASHEEIRQQIRIVEEQLISLIGSLDNRLVTHVNDKTNPHATTKAQVGLGSVDNYATATAAEALAGLVNNRFMTPALANTLAQRIAAEHVADHEAKKTNPHAVTKAQVGLGNVDNYLTATQAQATNGTANDKFMTPLRTKEAINAIAGNLLQAHINNTSNPHSTTKAQVGLGNVDNYSTATAEQGISTTISDKFMTPQRTYQAIMSHAGNALNSHIGNLNNPHQTTAAQVGAYTTSQTDTLLSRKLGSAETAVNANRLENTTRASILSDAYAAVGSMGKRNVFISTVDPTGSQGAVGDIWLTY